MTETQIRSLGQEDPLEEGMAGHSCLLAWGIPWTEELGGLQSMRSQKVGNNFHSLISVEEINVFNLKLLHREDSSYRWLY